MLPPPSGHPNPPVLILARVRSPVRREAIAAAIPNEYNRTFSTGMCGWAIVKCCHLGVHASTNHIHPARVFCFVFATNRHRWRSVPLFRKVLERALRRNRGISCSSFKYRLSCSEGIVFFCAADFYSCDHVRLCSVRNGGKLFFLSQRGFLMEVIRKAFRQWRQQASTGGTDYPLQSRQ